jgi:hypothetical protein
MLGRVQRPSAYASAVIGTVSSRWAARSLTTAGRACLAWPRCLTRGKSAARSVLAALADWVGAHEADRMYLQVECDNIPALRAV